MAFNTYQLNGSQLTQMTRLCYQEQGSDTGAAAEASLACNLFELRCNGSYSGQTGGNGLVAYCYRGGWFGNSRAVMDGTAGNTRNPSEAQKNNIKNVICNGNRTIPGYIDEHDCLSDISYVENGSKSDPSSFQQHVTKIHNVYGSTWWFWGFPAPGSDPFGYTSQENRQRIGDDYTSAGGSSSTDSSDETGAPIVAVSYETKPRVIETAKTVEGTGSEEWKTFYKFNMSSPVFISQMLTPYAVSAKTGQSGYRLWFDDYSPYPEENCTVYFKPDSYNIRYDRGLLEDLDKHYTFQTGTGVDSNVIEFNPSCSGILTAVTGGGEVDATIIDAIKNEIIHDFHNQFKDEYAPRTGDSVDMPEGQVTVLTASSYSKSELESMAASLWYNMRNIGFDADMVIVGDPELEVQSICTVLVIKKDGLPHYTSGTYLITRIVDDITAGTYQSTLSLVRNAMDMAVNESGGLDITLSQNTLYVGMGAASSSSGGTSAGGGSASNADVEKAVQWAIDIANSPDHGYDWGSRNGPDYDCSSLVYHAFKQAGFNVMSGNVAGSTYTMRKDFTAAGFTWHSGMGNTVDGLQRGDILLDEASHVEIYIGNNQNVGAHISETGGTYCGQKGDQTGHEIDVGKWYAHPWDGVLRYGG